MARRIYFRGQGAAPGDPAVIGKRKKQTALFDVGNVFDLELDPRSFHAQLAVAGPALFPDPCFDDLYCADNGRPSVPPAELALLVLLQYHAGVSDQEAVDRSAYDLRWAAVLRRTAGTPLCARTTLIHFRARLALHDASERLFDRALQHAKAQGLLPAGALRVILDTKPLVGRGAVEDTYNLLARSMDRLLDALAVAAGQPVAAWAAAHDFSAYVRSREHSLKGQAEVDWSDRTARQGFLIQVVTAARRLLALAAECLSTLAEPAAAAVRAESELLTQLLAQDVSERPSAGNSGNTGNLGNTGNPGNTGSPSPTESAESASPAGNARPAENTGNAGGAGGAGGAESGTPGAAAFLTAELKEGTARDRIPSATDPEQRHGHKSASKKFTGHKTRVAVEPESQLIVGVEVLAGNAGDAEGALAQVQAVEARLGQTVAETVGDCAFGSGATRQEFVDAERTLRAKVPGTPERWEIPKSRFLPVWEGDQVVSLNCPRGHTTTEHRDLKGKGRVFTFGPECRRCPLRHKCVQSDKQGASRTVQIHPQERLLQEARAYQASPEGKQILRERVVVEHALARLSGLGIGQARYVGRRKTRVQLLMTATVANLRRLWNWQAQKGEGPTAELQQSQLIRLFQNENGGWDGRRHRERAVRQRGATGPWRRAGHPRGWFTLLRWAF